jgi:hypothetical protein
MTTQETIDFENFSFDDGPEEPKLCALRGYDDCENCYFRLSTLKRITRSVKQLQAGGV